MRRHLQTLLIAGLAAVQAVGPGCKPSKTEKPEDEIVQTLRNRFTTLARADLAYGGDDINEQEVLEKNLTFLRELKKNNPQEHQVFLLQIALLLKDRSTQNIKSDADVIHELNYLNIEELFVRSQARKKMADERGIVQFGSAEQERTTSLAAITPDETIDFEILNPTTAKKMGITPNGPFRCIRVKRDSRVFVGEKEINVPAGTFVVEASGGKWFKVLVHTGDRLIDSLTRAFEGKKNVASYETIMKSEYADLLARQGISFEEHYKYFLKWAAEKRIPPNENAMHMFFDELRKRKASPRESAETGQNRSAHGKDTVQKASDALEGRRDEDENRLSYHDQRVRHASEQADILRKKYGVLFSLVRIQGQFSDLFTYNRITKRFSSQLAATVIGEEEYLAITDIRASQKLAGQDVKRDAKPSNFAHRLNENTVYDKNSADELKNALAFSESRTSALQASANDFDIQFLSNGTIHSVTYRGKPYEPRTFLTSPSKLKGIPNDQFSFSVGNLQYTANLQNYFNDYRALEDRNNSMSQSVLLYNSDTNQISQVRNPMWFVEGGNNGIYRDIAARATQGVSGTTQKVLSLTEWSRANLDYIREGREVNKTSLITLIDGGGDCEDSFTTLKTFANAAGIGNEVGAVIFKGHIAPIVRGKFGATRYQINGEWWTIVEIAVSRGTQVRAGETTKDNPEFFILPNGQMVSATGKVTPLNIVPMTLLDQTSVNNFRDAARLLDSHLTNSINDPSQQASNNQEAEEIAKGLYKKIKVTFGAIASTGKMAEDLKTEFDVITQKYAKALNTWGNIAQQESDRIQKEGLDKTPEKYRAEWKQFHSKAEFVATNLAPTAQRFLQIVSEYQGRERDRAAMVELWDRTVVLINDSGVYTALSEMQAIYEETLRFLPDGQKKLAKKVFDECRGLYNQAIGNTHQQIANLGPNRR